MFHKATTPRRYDQERRGIMTITASANRFDMDCFQAVSGAGNRIIGYDVARSFALLGMALINFTYIMVDYPHCSPLSQFLMNLVYGRASAIFVMLAGVGISLLTRHALRANDANQLNIHRKTLLKRAFFLFVTGICFALKIWRADILHFYGVYMLAGVSLLNASDRRLWEMAGLFTGVFLVMMLFMDFEPDLGWALVDETGSWHLATGLKNLFFNGYHPVFPWTAFLILGMWLGRRDITHPVLRWKIFSSGLVIYVTTEVISRLLIQFLSDHPPGTTASEILWLFETTPMPPSPFYMISASAQSMAVIMGCVMLAHAPSLHKWFKPLADAGQMSLTLYIGHILAGLSLVHVFEVICEYEDLATAACNAAVFYVTAVLFSFLWRRYFTRGPMEFMMRWASR